MKKLVLLLAVVFSVSLFSCGNKAQEAPAEEVEATETEVVTETPACCDKENCEGEACQGDSATCAACCEAEAATEAPAAE